jgi:hypothetical protein
MSAVVELVCQEPDAMVGDCAGTRAPEQAAEREAKHHTTRPDQIPDTFSLRAAITAHGEVATGRIDTGLLVEPKQPIGLILEPAKVGSPLGPQWGQPQRRDSLVGCHSDTISLST